jgi:hypothetical protein
MLATTVSTQFQELAGIIVSLPPEPADAADLSSNKRPLAPVVAAISIMLLFE